MDRRGVQKRLLTATVDDISYTSCNIHVIVIFQVYTHHHSIITHALMSVHNTHAVLSQEATYIASQL